MILTAIHKKEMTEENVITGLFSVIFVAYCFLFANLGFIDIFGVVVVQFPYIFLVYSGTKSVLKAINRYDIDNNLIDPATNNKSKHFLKMSYSYIILIGVFLFVSFCSILVAWWLKGNMCIMLIHLFIPIYTALILWAQIKNLTEVGIFNPLALFTNYTFVAFTISLYEFADFFIYIFNQNIYSEYGKFYKDPTHIFDIFWILANIIFLLFIPRIKYLNKED
jgi:hypothetical protein